MTTLLFANNASTTLAQNITGVDTTIYLAAGQGSQFPAPITGQAFYATIYNTSNTIFEIVLVTNRTGDVLTVVRAQDGTNAQTWLVGDSIGMYPTKATMEKLVQNTQLQTGKYTLVQAAGTANAIVANLDTDLTALSDGMSVVVKPVYANTGACTLQLNLNGLVTSAIPIVKGYNLPLIANDIPSAGYPVALIYSAIYGAWVMQMPATLISPPVPPTYTITYMAVGGGGGAGYVGGGGGGGGGGGAYVSSTTALVGSVFTVYIGAGGVHSQLGSTEATQGASSGITGVILALGGYPGRNSDGPPAAGGASGNGFPGANGGGGAGQAASGFPGGNGLNTLIQGVSAYFGGGGGGMNGNAFDTFPGGLGGGGTGGYGGGNGTAYTGGGGGGGSGSTGGNGGSGFVVMSIPTSRYTGTVVGSPTIYTSGANTILEFRNSGSYTA